MVTVTDVVKVIGNFWDNPPLNKLNPIDDTKLYIVDTCNRYGCKIIDIETGSSSSWWDYSKLQKVRDGSFEELDAAISKGQ